jgi:hypothetical protein
MFKNTRASTSHKRLFFDVRHRAGIDSSLLQGKKLLLLKAIPCDHVVKEAVAVAIPVATGLAGLLRHLGRSLIREISRLVPWELQVTRARALERVTRPRPFATRRLGRVVHAEPRWTSAATTTQEPQVTPTKNPSHRIQSPSSNSIHYNSTRARDIVRNANPMHVLTTSPN